MVVGYEMSFTQEGGQLRNNVARYIQPRQRSCLPGLPSSKRFRQGLEIVTAIFWSDLSPSYSVSLIFISRLACSVSSTSLFFFQVSDPLHHRFPLSIHNEQPRVGCCEKEHLQYFLLIHSLRSLRLCVLNIALNISS